MDDSRDISPPPTKRLKLSHSPKLTINPIITVEVPNPVERPMRSKESNCGPRDTIRIFSWNINGISPFIQNAVTSYFTSSKKPFQDPNLKAKPASASLRDFLRRHRWPELLFLQEVKINPSDTKTQLAVQTAVNPSASHSESSSTLSADTEAEETYLTFFTLPTDKFNARSFGGKVYGVATIIRESFYQKYVKQVREVEWDLEGRVSLVLTTNKLAIFNIYAVNGTSNPYRSPTTGEVRGTRHDRKREFHRLLAEETKTLQDQGYEVVIAGDLNIAPTRIDGWPNLRTFPIEHVANRADFHARFLEISGDPPSNNIPVNTEALQSKLKASNDADQEAGEVVSGLGMIDIYRALNPGVKKFSFHPRTVAWGSSCDRVDLILVSKELWRRGGVVEAEIWDSPQERGPSDHVPISVEVRMYKEEMNAGEKKREVEGKG